VFGAVDDGEVGIFLRVLPNSGETIAAETGEWDSGLLTPGGSMLTLILQACERN